MKTIDIDNDLIFVVDVTSISNKYSNIDFTFEKCVDPLVKEFIEESL